MVKKLPTNEGAIRNTGFTPGLGRLLEDKAIHSSILAWRVPWTEGPGRQQSMELQGVFQVFHTFQV